MDKTDVLISKLYRIDDIKQIDNEIKMLGNTKITTYKFMNIRLVFTILIFILTIYFLDFGYILAPFIAFAFYHLLYYVYIIIPIRKRIIKLDNEALIFFEILTLALESGRNLENALEIAISNVDSELSGEFRRVLFDMKFGKSLIEALDDMKKRMPSEAINNILLNITQTDVFGSSIIDTMYNQIDFLRDKQLLQIKGQINKIPNKISIISVIFVVPLILILILGPFIINFLS